MVQRTQCIAHGPGQASSFTRTSYACEQRPSLSLSILCHIHSCRLVACTTEKDQTKHHSPQPLACCQASWMGSRLVASSQKNTNLHTHSASVVPIARRPESRLQACCLHQRGKQTLLFSASSCLLPSVLVQAIIERGWHTGHGCTPRVDRGSLLQLIE